LAERGLIESRSLAQKLVMAGKVRVDGQVVLKSASQVDPLADLQVESGPPFVSRGGEKLQAALHAFQVVATGQVCADVGASTGGFTDCLLQAGASRVYAIDVGYGILHWKLRSDPRIVSMERTNARYVQSLPEPVSLVTIDASFISLKVLLPVVRNWFPPRYGEIIALIKPQFEAGREEASRGGGVIKDPKIHKKVVEEILGFARTERYSVQGVIQSPLKGPKGNIEFLVYMKLEGHLEPSDKPIVRAQTMQ
jgi:23S rRNA (cytidine1920-2'-O)/16S rRNA (cytidine1409-2'-O)-methyltransferase